MKNTFTVVLCVYLLTASAAGQTIYTSNPDWTSGDTQVGTGGALADINGDGWPDLVVANGNDMQQQRLVVYYNQGDGTLSSTPDWQSADTAYNGHLDIADVNGDGWLDVAVAVLGRYSTVDNSAKLYLNNAGVLSTTPDWESNEIGNAFGCAFGDMNNDGRPDLAVATGWAYDPQNHYNNYVYLNIGGALSASASWVSNDISHYQGVLWVDADSDGWMDLVGVPNDNPTQLYLNLSGTLETTASWQTADGANQDAIMAVAGDVTGDGHRDLFVTDNTQLAGSGLFRQYSGLAAGTFNTSYGWNYYDGYGSALALADVDADGNLDLATGAWWDHTRLFFGDGSGLETSPTWSSGPTSVIEKIVFADIDRDGVSATTEAFPADGRRLFYLERQPIERILAVSRDGVALSPSEFTFSREFGWVTIGVAATTSVEIEYEYSIRLDMAITNWDNSVGNYVYYNHLDCAGDLNDDGRVDLIDLAHLLGNYGCTAACTADLDGDDDTDLSDLAILLSTYGCGT